MKKWLLHNVNVDIQNINIQPSFNSNDKGDCVWEIKEAPEGLIGVYLDGGAREGMGFKFTLMLYVDVVKTLKKCLFFTYLKKDNPNLEKK